LVKVLALAAPSAGLERPGLVAAAIFMDGLDA